MVEWTVDAFSGVGVEDARAHETADGSKTVTGRVPGPPGAPTVPLYFHHDVQPASDEGWESPPWELTERNGRWYGRGAADCKGSLTAHLAALRALGQEPPVTVKIVGEGSEEQGTGGLEGSCQGEPRPAPRRRDPRLRHGQRRGRRADADREPARDGQGLVTVRTLRAPCTRACSAAPHRTRSLHSSACSTRCGTSGATRRSAGSTVRRSGRVRRIPEQLRKDAGVLDGVDVLRRRGGHAAGATRGHRARHRLPAGRRLVRRGASRGTRPHRPANPAGRGCEGGAVEADRASRGRGAVERPARVRARGRRRAVQGGDGRARLRGHDGRHA